jgi:hypothetical protein
MSQIVEENKVFDVFTREEKGGVYTINLKGKELKITHNKPVVSFCISENYIFFSDLFIVKCLNMQTKKTDTLNLSGFFLLKSLRYDKILLISKNRILYCDCRNKKIKNLNFMDFSDRNIKDVYILSDSKFKIGLDNGCIVFWEKGFSYKKQLVSKNVYFKGKFSHDGKLFILSHGENADIGVKIIHEDSPIEDDEICIIKNLVHDFHICEKTNYLITTCFGKNRIFDISCIGNLKRMQCFEFISGMYENRESVLNVFFKHYLFDINVVKLIFSFLPYSTVDFNPVIIN